MIYLVSQAFVSQVYLTPEITHDSGGPDRRNSPKTCSPVPVFLSDSGYMGKGVNGCSFLENRWFIEEYE